MQSAWWGFIEAEYRTLPHDGHRGCGADQGSELIDAHDFDARWWSEGELGQARPQSRNKSIEVWNDAEVGEEPQAPVAWGVAIAQAGNPTTHDHRTSTAACDRGTTLIGSDDGFPDKGVTEGVGEERRVAAGKIDESSAIERLGELGVICLFAVGRRDGHLCGPKPGSGLATELNPVVETFRAFLSGGRWNLDVAAPAVEQPTFDGGHLWKVLP